MSAWLDSVHWSVAIVAFWGMAILRSSLVYSLGRLASSGTERLERIRHAFQTSAYRRAEAFVHRWGVLAVPLCYLTVGFQTAVILTTGFTRMPLARWIPAMLVGSLIWGIIYGTVGMAVIWAWLSKPWLTAGLIAVVALVVTVMILLRPRGERTPAPPADTAA